MLSCRTALPMLTGAGDLGGRSLAGPTFGLRCVHLWQGRRGFVGLQPCLHVPDQEPWPSAPRQINCWGEVLRPKIKGVTHTSGVGAVGGGQLWEGYCLAGAGIHGGIFPKDLRHVRRKNGTFLRFLSRAMLGLKLIPTCGADGGWCGFAHTVYRAWTDVLRICAGRSH